MAVSQTIVDVRYSYMYQDSVPLACDASRVHALLADEPHVQAALHLVRRAHAQLLVPVLEDALVADVDGNGAGMSLGRAATQHVSKIGFLVVEVDGMGVPKHALERAF